MSDALTKLIALGAAAIEAATRRGGAKWEREMERIITTQMTAAYIAATAQRLGVTPDSALISRARLSRAERADIEAAVREQIRYLRRFAEARGGMSEAAIMARARMYATGVKAFYHAQRWGAWEIPDRLIPGRQSCLGNCKCDISVADNGDGTGVLTRTMGGTENHCSECPPLVGSYPVRRRGAA